ncbi:GNAT family N-acetyltransferase [Mycobacterium sp. ITM-2016-00318]|uniref:GNAT family N-acetyltransferase n=1 Tax=Mycobacterium sp. ITM-2016-00318 TaxID=2099693 RepID=UPI0026797560|nr:GNAT family N-acetyltransferase [Mycobacterium sp. ITM-2016-00318]WNG91644.1 GNAT family N-acetyltransferase [Mycobacterium sp. ITM-2016-00318]
MTLRAPRLDDAEELFASVASDPEVTRYVTWTLHPDVEETRRSSAMYWPAGGGQRLIAEVVDLLLAEMTSDPMVRRLSAICHVDNTRSARVLSRAGLSLEGRLVRHTVFPNLGREPQDVLQFGQAVVS